MRNSLLKFGLNIIIATSVLSCTDEEIVIRKYDDVTNLNENIYRVSEKEAKDMLAFVMDQFEPITTYGSSKRTIKDVQAWRIDKQIVNTYSSMIANDFDLGNIDTLVYIINFEDYRGFAFVSADKRTVPVLAIIDEGFMTVEDFKNIDNPGFIAFMENTVTMLLNEIATHREVIPTYAMSSSEMSDMIQTRSTELRNYPPRLQTKWGQGYPYNYRCDFLSYQGISKRAVTGCVPTAMAQALSFFKTISYVSWSEPGYGSGGGSLDWTQIILDSGDWYWAAPHPIYGYPYNNENQYGYGRVGYNPFKTTTAQVASLMRYLGVKINAKYVYNKDGLYTEASDTKAVDFLKKTCGLSSSSSLMSFNTTNVFNSFSNYYSLIYSRADSKKKTFLGMFPQYSGGHAWIIDGGREIQYSSNDIKKYMHCNYGWDGYCDGYYLGDSFNISSGPLSTDPNIELGGTANGSYMYENKYAILKP